MFEVEAKVRLKKSDLKRVRKILETKKIPKKTLTKKDDYYGNEKAFFLRLREEGGKISLDLKSKKRIKGVEMNQELEIPVKSRIGFHKLLKKWGFPLVESKKKISAVYRLKNFSIELNKIPGLGDYLEIETIVPNKDKIPAAKRRLQKLFKKLGFLPAQFEKKYYLELLQERRKNY